MLEDPFLDAGAVYDLEVDTSLLAPEECALQIKARMESGSAPNAFLRLRQNIPET
jgi:hypothetical protein